jgi:hypothetical protein
MPQNGPHWQARIADGSVSAGRRVWVVLALKTWAVSVAFGTASFFMADDDRTIRVDVTQSLLAQIDGPPPKSKNGYVERITRHRGLFAKIAAGKYDAGQYWPEVNVLVVRIDVDDLLRDREREISN